MPWICSSKIAASAAVSDDEKLDCYIQRILGWGHYSARKVIVLKLGQLVAIIFVQVSGFVACNTKISLSTSVYHRPLSARRNAHESVCCLLNVIILAFSCGGDVDSSNQGFYDFSSGWVGKTRWFVEVWIPRTPPDPQHSCECSLDEIIITCNHHIK